MITMNQQKSMSTRIINIIKPLLDEQKMVYNYEPWNHRKKQKTTFT